jgi:hypothetical protein
MIRFLLGAAIWVLHGADTLLAKPPAGYEGSDR